MGLYCSENPMIIYVSHIDKVTACDGRTDGQTDGFTIASTALCIASYAEPDAL